MSKEKKEELKRLNDRKMFLIAFKKESEIIAASTLAIIESMKRKGYEEEYNPHVKLYNTTKRFIITLERNIAEVDSEVLALNS